MSERSRSGFKYTYKAAAHICSPIGALTCNFSWQQPNAGRAEQHHCTEVLDFPHLCHKDIGISAEIPSSLCPAAFLCCSAECMTTDTWVFCLDMLISLFKSKAVQHILQMNSYQSYIVLKSKHSYHCKHSRHECKVLHYIDVWAPAGCQT